MAASSKAAQTAQRWYQSKRVPLYVVVGATVTSAATYLYTHSGHPSVRLRRSHQPRRLPAGCGSSLQAPLLSQLLFFVWHHDPLRRQQGKSITSFAASPCRFECSQQFSCSWRPMCIKSCKAASKRGLEADARGDNLLCNVAPARFGTFTLCSHLQALDEDVTYLTLFQGGGAGTGQQGGAHERIA